LIGVNETREETFRVVVKVNIKDRRINCFNSKSSARRAASAAAAAAGGVAG